MIPSKSTLTRVILIVNPKWLYLSIVVLQIKANQGNFYQDVYAMSYDKYMDETDKDCEYEYLVQQKKVMEELRKEHVMYYMK